MADYANLGLTLYLGAIALVLLGGYAVLASRHLLRAILGLTLLQAGAALFLVAAGFRPGAVAPILEPATIGRPMVDPVAQALALAAIVIGTAVLALALVLAVRVRDSVGSLDRDHLAETIARAGRGEP